MRKLLALACVAGLVLAWIAAAGLAKASIWCRSVRAQPPRKHRGTVDGASLSITYGRPSMRGRKIFGSLVPFDRIWCPGADECTRLSSDHDLQFAGLR